MSVSFQQIPSPCYVLEERLLRANLEKLNYVQQQSGVEIICALKGFAMYSTFDLVRQYLGGATASSLNEAKLCNEYMHSKAHLYSPVYVPAEFDELMNLSNHITFNSLRQWHTYAARIKSYHRHLHCALRINPEYSEVEVDMYNPTVPGSRLGVRAEDMPTALPEGINGLHFHSLCESNSFALENTLKAVEEKFAAFLPKIEWFNMGGGHLITRKDYDVEHLISVLRGFRSRYPNLKKVILEPGSAVAWQTGYLVSEVLDIVHSKGIEIAMLDVSFAAHMPDTLEMPYKPRILGATDAIAGKPTYRMGGGTCLAGDYLGDYSFDKPLAIGDKIIFDDMIHYTMVKTTTFNGVNLPAIGIWKENDTFQLIKTFGYESYKDRLS